MKKININIILSIILATGMFSCVDLDLPSDGRLTMKDIFGNYSKTRNYYSNCHYWMPQIGFTYQNNTPLASFCDEAHDASDYQNGAVNDWYNDRTSPFSNPLTYTSDYWSHYFQGIRKCNTFLAYISDPDLATAEIHEDEKNGWIAEVHVLRAYYYLQLVRRYGGVPVINTLYEVTHDFSQDRRASFEECADLIIADCDAALATAEVSNPAIGFRWMVGDNERGALTRAVAYAIKSQTALYAASPLWFTAGSKYTWERAATITKEALDECLTHGFQLYNTPVDADIAQNPYAYYFIQRSDPSRSMDKETIYESSVTRSNVWRDAGLPITSGMLKAGAGPSQELVDCYEMKDGTPPILGYSDANHLQPVINPAATLYDPQDPYANRDPRFYASIYYNGAPKSLSAAAPVVETFVGGNCGISNEVTDIRFTRTGYYMRKFNNYRSSPSLDADGYMKGYRLGELYLNFAEAAYQAYGADAPVASAVAGGSALSARDAVNAVRARAEMPPLPAGLSKEDFEKRYRNERRVELAFEEHRFYDVRRWKILNETDAFVTGMRITKNGDGYTYTRIKLANRGTNVDKYLLFPIRQDDINKMERYTGTSWQNPGWE
jgi:hypothetical protein